MPRYWAVGAFVSGQDMFEDFVLKGMWFGDREDRQEDIAQISVGDRIAIKKRLGSTTKQAQIRAIGIVVDVRDVNATLFKFFFVNWINIDKEDRRIPISGLFTVLHEIGPETDLRRVIFAL